MGETLTDRFNSGKHLAPITGGLMGWARPSDGHEFVCTTDELADLVATLQQLVPVTQKSASFTPSHVDAFTLIEFLSNTTTQVLTMPTDASDPLMGIGSVIGFQQIGTAAVTWPAGIVPGTATVIGGVTYRVPLNLTIQAFVYYTWRKRAANDWILS